LGHSVDIYPANTLLQESNRHSMNKYTRRTPAELL